jgi:hypothetical protein
VRNLVSGNGFGVTVVNAGAKENEVLGNFIGLDASGEEDLGNAGSGVVIELASDNTVGGTEAGNVISGNGGAGVVLARAARDNDVLGNLIGTAKDGISPLGNSLSGVFIGFAGADGNTVGGNVPESSNTIAFSGADGASIVDEAAGNRILRNSIHSNEDLGIDLADEGTTANDFGDFDSGPNDLQNFPVLSSAKTGTKATTVTGSLRSAPENTFAVRFFENPSGGNEGKSFVAQRSVTTNADGIGSFSLTLEDAKRVPVGKAITATATNDNGSTSEFSAPRKVVRQ